MILPWRKRRANKMNNKQLCDGLDVEVMIPTHFQCPISLDLMKDPVTLCTGITYDRESIERWIEAGNETCPVTKQVSKTFDLIPNHILRRFIQDWCVENRSHGVERIPTPRVPVSPYQVSEACSRIVDATQRGDGNKCGELVKKIKNWGKESERNKRCVVENGTGCSLSATFESFASVSLEKHMNLLREILSVLSWFFPLGEEGRSKLVSESSLHCIIWFLRNGDLSSRQNAILVLKELLYSDETHVISKTLLEIEEVVETLVHLIKEPISPTATKASLMAIYYLITSMVSNGKITSRFLEMGLVPVIVEIIVEAEKSVCEKALAVLDAICNTEKGKEEAYKNALIMPVLVKKILRVSNSATELSLSIFWKLCKNEIMKDEESAIIDAIQLGAFQKLLVILQVGCGETTKEKVTKLLKLLNVYKNRVDCVDSSMDFKYLKRPF
ncbi:U-box domain-containing protein 21 [Durio zibethinus]|uniref:U-box domain-containing protein n=1 Tax=Durio zibethinus TaxID=66656 RepID=A0A6P6A5D8_DURZI|nr:U-box domain-containing protein 21 [Durio zibethinus]